MSGRYASEVSPPVGEAEAKRPVAKQSAAYREVTGRRQGPEPGLRSSSREPYTQGAAEGVSCSGTGQGGTGTVRKRSVASGRRSRSVSVRWRRGEQRTVPPPKPGRSRHTGRAPESEKKGPPSDGVRTVRKRSFASGRQSRSEASGGETKRSVPGGHRETVRPGAGVAFFKLGSAQARGCDGGPGSVPAKRRHGSGTPAERVSGRQAQRRRPETMLCAGDRSAAAKAGTEPARPARPETEATGWARGRGWEAYETMRRRLRPHRAGRSAASRVFGEERTQHGAGAVRNDQSGRSRSWRGGISMDGAPFFEGTSGTEGGAEHQLTDGISRIRAGRRAAKPGYRPRPGRADGPG